MTNTGDRAGREVVQVYTALPGSRVQRPPRELKAFASVPLEPGETREVELTVRREDIAYWDVRVEGWIVEGGPYTVEVGASSRDLRTATSIDLEGDPGELEITLSSTFEEILAHPVAGPALQSALDARYGEEDAHLLTMIGNFPVNRLDGFPLPREELEAIVARAR